jgi:signal transduction histidine kinase
VTAAALDVARPAAPVTRLDLGVAAALAAWALAEAPFTGGPLGLAVTFALVTTLPLALRRRFPAAVLLVVGAALPVHVLAGGALATSTPFPGLLIAAFTVAAQVAPTPVAAALGMVPIASILSGSVLGEGPADDLEPGGVVILCFFVAGAWGGGRLVRHRAMSALAAERNSDVLAAEAVAAERARIARELHDVVAHAVSVVVLQTAAAEGFLDKDPERARTHLGLARRTATEAMTEMRHLLGVLREDTAVYDPQPGLDRLEDLVADARAGGLEVDLELSGDVAAVPDGPGLAVYRIVQESLTNVRRHAAGTGRCSVAVAVGRERVLVEVVNAGPAGTPPAPREDGGGRGLPGMRERVRVYGGTLEAGSSADGGWAVRAALPLVRA